ncbi:MAG: Re/Si-specific NAD(P)(+) transhydrogenase subunit alpha [Candidatus Eisenbacteria bacterium]|uniref:proton-translocating NAD(P)(+) transhydrogenase n=1 Tax=Eiseniibacteriota bacterium TaxID=2212470 RepID=A0A956RPQ4_UNCEI|nr:Re/Si-specific NAD(P)(+) transhydrogenase subunit alpha [Candidatus Eisenbacteria bacterium]
MRLGVPAETLPGEQRVALVPQGVKKLTELGFEVVVESKSGEASGFPDSFYEAAGATIGSRADALGSDMVVRVRPPQPDEVAALHKGTIHVSLLDPFNEKALVAKLAAQGVTGICLELIPRSTKAQRMDVLSSQANLAGYLTVILAADHLDRIFPMMMTPAGTLPPARVFVIGAGVAGLQAIATAKRLGARVEAFDTRPVVAEQVQSLGAKFLQIDLGETGQTEQGYARELTPQQLAMQRDAMKKAIILSDVVISTAQVFGRKAPVIVTKDMITEMRPGAVVVDMAVESGGNVEGSQVDQVTVVNGVKIVGMGNLPSRVARDSSTMFSNNVVGLIGDFWDKETKTWKLDRDDEVIQGALLTHEGEVVQEKFR